MVSVMTTDSDRIYDQGEKIGQINGKLDSLLNAFDSHTKEIREWRDDITQIVHSMEADINKAKGAKAAILGAAGIIAAGISTAVAAIGKWIG